MSHNSFCDISVAKMISTNNDLNGSTNALYTLFPKHVGSKLSGNFL